MPREVGCLFNRKHSQKKLDVITYIILSCASLFAIFPILWALNTSLKPESLVLTYPPNWIPTKLTLENYYLVLFKSSIPRALFNSFFVTLSAVGVVLIVATLAGYSSARFSFKGKNLILFYILMTSMIPGIAVLVPLYYIASHLGLINKFGTLIYIFAGAQTPMAIWIIKGFFESIPKEIEDAAMLDGCSSFRILYQIMIPLVQPGIAAAGIIAFVFIWNDFIIAATFITKSELRLINVSLYQFLSQYGIIWGQLMAAVIVTLLPVVFMFVLLESRFIQGLSAGAVKG